MDSTVSVENMLCTVDECLQNVPQATQGYLENVSIITWDRSIKSISVSRIVLFRTCLFGCLSGQKRGLERYTSHSCFLQFIVPAFLTIYHNLLKKNYMSIHFIDLGPLSPILDLNYTHARTGFTNCPKQFAFLSFNKIFGLFFSILGY